MQFQVPQFIEVEDKIFGPLTFKQFAYIAGGVGFSFLIYTYVRHISTILAILLIIPGGGFFLALAFHKINGRPMISTVEAAFKYITGRKLYLWKKNPNKTAPMAVTISNNPESTLPRLSGSKLKDLSWSLDIKENLEN